MSDDTTAKINAAVDACLERCTSAQYPRRELELILQEAQDAGELTAEEATIVQEAVKRILLEHPQG